MFKFLDKLEDHPVVLFTSGLFFISFVVMVIVLLITACTYGVSKAFDTYRSENASKILLAEKVRTIENCYYHIRNGGHSTYECRKLLNTVNQNVEK